MPEHYLINGSRNTKIHHSRLIRFDGVRLPTYEQQMNSGFGDSVITRLYPDILNLSIATECSASMIFEAGLDVVSVENLPQMMQDEHQRNTLIQRFTLAGMFKSINNMLLLDSREKFERKNHSFSGLSSLIDKYSEQLAAAADIPVTRFMGASPSGLNATGEGELKIYYDMIKSAQNAVYRPKLELLDKLMIAHIGSNLEPPEFEFNSLMQMSEIEIADAKLKNAQADQINVLMESAPVSAIARQLQEKGTYQIPDEWIDELESMPMNKEMFINPEPEETAGQ
jgi:phage-related protein (TIGR01555 family)